MPFGQVIVGPPGSGKTTYCHMISQVYQSLERNVVLVNLDPANDCLPYIPQIDISQLIQLEDVMNQLSLGPNGAMMYCIEYLEENMDWLIEQLKKYGNDAYFLFDFPGQAELYTHHLSVQTILRRLENLDFRLCAVHLVDAHHCTDPSKYIAVLLLSLKTMLQLEIPHVNVLSKIDLIESYGKLSFNLDFYTEVQDLSYLLERLNTDSCTKRYKALNQALCDLIEEFGLVSFYTLHIENKESILNLMRVIDKANGYIFGGLEPGNDRFLFETASRTGILESVGDVQEKYLD